MELRQLRYFIELVKIQNYSHAANNLFITQPTLSWNMKKLQDELGVKLLYQVSNKVMPTTAGSALYERGKEILAEFDDLITKIESDNTYEKKELVIGSNAIISQLFMPLIKEFMTYYPNFSVNIKEAGSYKIQKEVVQEKLEIGIVSFPITEGNLEMERNINYTFNYNAYFVLKKTHKLAESKTLSIRDLKNESFCSMNKDYVLYYFLKDLCRENGFKPKIELMSNNHDLVFNHIKENNSVAIMPIELKDESDDSLVWIEIKEKIKPFDIVVIHKKDKPLSPAAALCLEFITNQKIQ